MFAIYLALYGWLFYTLQKTPEKLPQVEKAAVESFKTEYNKLKPYLDGLTLCGMSFFGQVNSLSKTCLETLESLSERPINQAKIIMSALDFFWVWWGGWLPFIYLWCQALAGLSTRIPLLNKANPRLIQISGSIICLIGGVLGIVSPGGFLNWWNYALTAGLMFRVYM